MQKLTFFCGPCSSGEWDDCESKDWVDAWDHISLAIDPCVIVEST
jgi:hypothetical protein